MVKYGLSRVLWSGAIAVSSVIASMAAMATPDRVIVPEDPHFQTLQVFGERYNCPIESESALTREEFAVGLQNCFQTIRMQQMMLCLPMAIVSPEDAILFQELDAEFATELTALGETSDRLDFLNPFGSLFITEEE